MGKKTVSPAHPARVLLSEVLPYEVPPQYSNRHLYRFVVRHDLEYRGDEVTWKESNREIEHAIKTLVGVNANEPTSRRGTRRVLKIRAVNFTIPFTFTVAKNNDEARTLSIPHPRHQLAMVCFYRDYAQLLLHYTDRPSFSIRRPARISKYSYSEDRLHSELRTAWTLGVAEAQKEYDTFRSFFAYERYSNVYRFFESDLYQALEKRYRHHLKVDISRCFESIYTHSIAWAIYGKDDVKRNIDRDFPTFPERFDFLMQKINYNETNGILVGSEFSRIFAEILLQAVDLDVVRELASQGMERGRHYEILRYVDDYFVFYDQPAGESMIRQSLQKALSPYGLSLNRSKELRFDTPDISPISVAKSRISDLLEGAIRVSRSPGEDFDLMRASGPRALITSYKTIIKETGAREGDVLNYALALVEQRLRSGLIAASTEPLSDRERSDLASSLGAILEFCFFIYSASPRVNPTVKLSRVLIDSVEFARSAGLTLDQRHGVFDVVHGGIVEQLEKAHSYDQVQVENLYLLSCLVPLGREYLLPPDHLMRLFSIGRDSRDELEFRLKMNHFSLSTLLHYVQSRTRYAEIRGALESKWLTHLSSLPQESAERVFMLLDGVASPHLSEGSRFAIAAKTGLKTRADRQRLTRLRPSWFMKWRDFNLGDELDLKRNQEVY